MRRTRPGELRRLRPLLGTFVEIRVTGEPSRLECAVAAAFAAVERVQRLMSFHDPGSELSRLNQAQPGEMLQLDEHTHAVLRIARALGDWSYGLFDPTVAGTLVRQGFLPRPGTAGVRSGLPPAGRTARATYRDLELLPGRRVRWRRKGWIDLGGIAKGFAVDRAIAALQSHGVASAVVNAGGDLRSFGAPEPIHVRSPEDSATLLRIGTLVDGAIATSADYFSHRASGGQRIGALVDPRRAACVAWGRSVSVVAATCTLADALTKVVALAPERAPRSLRQLDAQALVLERGHLWISAHTRASRFEGIRSAA
jgi:FAD:protein FMN transferase